MTQRRPTTRRANPAEDRPPKLAAETGPHGGNPKAELTAFVALLLLSSLAGWTWADAQTAPLEGPDGARQTEQPAKNAPQARDPDLPAVVRPRPRGLPQGGEGRRDRPRDRAGFPRLAGKGVDVNELARAAGDGGRPPETRAYAAPPEVGLIPLICRGMRRFLGSGSLGSPAVEVFAPGRKTGQVSRSYRSAMDAGVTGGMALLSGGPRDSGHPG